MPTSTRPRVGQGPIRRPIKAHVIALITSPYAVEKQHEHRRRLVRPADPGPARVATPGARQRRQDGAALGSYGFRTTRNLYWYLY